MNLPQHLAGIDPAKELEWQLKCNCSRQRVLLFLWCIQAGQANGAWRLNSFLCSNVALSLPKATRHLCGRWEVRSWGNNQGNVCNQPLQRWQGWPAANGPTTHCHLLAPPQEGRHKSGHPEVFSFSFFFKFYFIFKLYIIVLVLPNIKMNPSQVYMCSPSWTLLPPQTIPLGRPSALAPSIQYRALNLDWHLVSYMIFYMFQCHSPKFLNLSYDLYGQLILGENSWE